MLEKERIFDTLFEMASELEDKDAEEITDLQREEVEKLKEEFNHKTTDTWNTIMAHEMTLVNETERVLALFEANLTDMMNNFITSVRNLFSKARAADIRYFRRLSELGEAIEELPYVGDDESQKDCAGTTKVSTVISLCHDGHQELLLEEESKLQKAIDRWREDFLAKFKKKERKRNRNRILELNHFIDTMRQEEDELDVLPQQQLNLVEDILID